MPPATRLTDSSDDRNLARLATTYPAFRFTLITHASRTPRWLAVRKNSADQGLYAALTGDLDELRATLARDAERGTLSQPAGHDEPRYPALTPPCATRLRPGCPALAGAGTDLSATYFVLVVDDVPDGPDRRPVDVWGYFRLPGDENDDDVLLTDGLEVPAGSPIARLAHRVSADPGRTRKAGDMLRSNVTTCPCTPTNECPALNDIRLLEAMEHADATPLCSTRGRLSGL